MKKTFLLSTILLFATFVTAFVVLNKNTPVEQPNIQQQEPPVRPKTVEDALNSISLDKLKDNLYYLSSEKLEGRMSGKKGNVLAAEFIKNKFEEFGLETIYQKFSIKRLNPGPKNEKGNDFTQNIYAYIEGNDPDLKDEIVVIGAHMDHIGYGPSMSRSRSKNQIHPGADDNASGTAALLEIAKAFSILKGQNKRTVVFQAYSAEEMGLIGSRFYCENPLFPKDNPNIKKHVFMLNMDMVGYLNKGTYLASFNEGDSSIDLGNIIKELDEKYSFANKITSRGSGGSDHACFYNKRIPVAFLHTGGHSHYHTPNDTPDKINYDGLKEIARYAFELSWKVANNEESPKFNHAKFIEMSYEHDHGNPDMTFENN
jgi:hypothetical protein